MSQCHLKRHLAANMETLGHILLLPASTASPSPTELLQSKGCKTEGISSHVFSVNIHGISERFTLPKTRSNINIETFGDKGNSPGLFHAQVLCWEVINPLKVQKRGNNPSQVLPVILSACCFKSPSTLVDELQKESCSEKWLTKCFAEIYCNFQLVSKILL